MKRYLLIINLVLVAVMVLSACAPAATEVTSPVAPAAETTAPVEVATEAPPAAAIGKVHVTIFVGMGTGTDPEQIDAENALAEKFNSTHDNIEVEFLIVPYEQSRERLLAMLSGGTAPQLVGPMGIESTGQFLDSFEDLTPYIQKDNYDTSDFYGPAVSLNTYEGKNIGLPIGLYPSFIFYNKSAFDAAGVAYPTHDYADKTWTIEKLRETAMLVTLDKNGKNATAADFDPANIQQYGLDDSWETLRGWSVLWAPKNMGRPTTADFKTAVVNDPDWVTAAQWYSDAIWKDHFMPDAEAVSAMDPTNGDPFAVNGLAMWFCHTWYMSESLNSLPFKWDIAPVPYNPKGERIARVDADVFGMPKDAKNKDEAWIVLKWLLEPENNLELCRIYGCMPARKSTEQAYKSILNETYAGIDLAVIFNAADYLDVPNHESWIPEFGTVNEALANAQSQLWTTDQNHDAASVLDATNAEIQKTLDAYWASH